MKYKVKEATRTCEACPSQWDLTADNGEYIYVRYRWGHLRVTLHAFTEQEETLWSENFGDEYDGSIGWNDMMDLTSNVLDWSEWDGVEKEGGSLYIVDFTTGKTETIEMGEKIESCQI